MIYLPYKLYTNFVHCILVENEKKDPEKSDGNVSTIYYFLFLISKNKF